MLEVRNLTKYFGGLLAVDDLSFEVQKGDIVGLVGPNGAGKSTTIKTLMGFIRIGDDEATRQSLDWAAQWLPGDIHLANVRRQFLEHLANLVEGPLPRN